MFRKNRLDGSPLTKPANDEPKEEKDEHAEAGENREPEQRGAFGFDAEFAEADDAFGGVDVVGGAAGFVWADGADEAGFVEGGVVEGEAAIEIGVDEHFVGTAPGVGVGPVAVGEKGADDGVGVGVGEEHFVGIVAGDFEGGFDVGADGFGDCGHVALGGIDRRVGGRHPREEEKGEKNLKEPQGSGAGAVGKGEGDRLPVHLVGS